jgi:signal transduction histidine kinase
MNGATKRAMILPDHSPLLGVADESVAKPLIREVRRFARGGHVVIASTLSQLLQLSRQLASDVIFLDSQLLAGATLSDSLRHFSVIAPVVVLAPAEWQAEVAPLVAIGSVDFVARLGDFIPLVASLIERRLRSAVTSGAMKGPPWAAFPADVATIFRHEINNPLTGILGNAELLLAHPGNFSSADTLRLKTIVDLCVRLRETIRRLSDAWEHPLPPAKSA